MTVMYLAANYSNLFAAEYFVDGQWNINELVGLESQTFIYFAAEGDENASAGQAEVKVMLGETGCVYNEISNIDAKASIGEMNEVMRELFSANTGKYFVNFEKGTVMPWYVPSSISEHMFSFKYGYRVEAARDWLFEQRR